MIMVLKHGNTIATTQPDTGETAQMVDVMFVEHGRPGVDRHMFESSQVLSKLTGEEMGLHQSRVHTQPVLASKIGHVPVGKALH